MTDSQRRSQAKYRAANIDKCRERSRNANRKRYNTDALYRVGCLLKSKNLTYRPTPQIVEDTLKG